MRLFELHVFRPSASHVAPLVEESALAPLDAPEGLVPATQLLVASKLPPVVETVQQKVAAGKIPFAPMMLREVPEIRVNQSAATTKLFGALIERLVGIP